MAIVMLIFAGAVYVTYLCFANISEQHDLEDKIILAFVGICVPITTAYLTLDFKSSSSNSK